MSSDSVLVTGPVTVSQDAQERVAFDLMKHISAYERVTEEQMQSRTYWLTLYHQCHLATKGSALERVLQVK